MVGTLTVVTVLVSTLAASEVDCPLELAGAAYIPHVGTPGTLFRRPPIAPLDARVQLFVRNNSANASEACRIGNVLFNGKEAVAYLKDEHWTWHDSPAVWKDTERNMPSGALTVWTFNSVGKQLDNALRVETSNTDGQSSKAFEIDINKPRLWLSSVTFLGPEDNLNPDRMIFYVRNETTQAVRIVDCRLFLPENRRRRRWLYPRPWFSDRLRPLSDEGRIESSELGGARVLTGRLPLTYAAVQVKLRSEDGDEMSLWAHLKIKKETFDISGGWVNGSTPKGPTLRHEPFLKTLRRMHINTAHIGEVSGYTDQTGPDGLYARYPLKRFHKLSPVERYDTDVMLPQIHAVEFLGEPQYRYGRNDKLPQQVLEAFEPYAGSRLATTLTLSESQNWHLYAGVSDYPHYDAYRVTAPSPDTWSLYDRWGGQRIRWGAPLETIGEMTRSLRETSRPVPIAYWSQGAHDGWGRYGGRAKVSPTPDELRLQAYHALSSRITSLYWFNLSLKSLAKFRDLIDEIARVGREIRMLDRFYLEGAACQYRQVRRDGRPDWDLASTISPDGALLFALDLDYEADPTDKVFKFGPPRPAAFEFGLPPWLRPAADVFRIDADGIYEVSCQRTAKGIVIDDRVSKVAIYVAAADAGLRSRLEDRRRELLRVEQSLEFDPAASDADFEELISFLAAD
jgi:hypothetical protein